VSLTAGVDVSEQTPPLAPLGFKPRIVQSLAYTLYIGRLAPWKGREKRRRRRGGGERRRR
jgi:hypothetical protein